MNEKKLTGEELVKDIEQSTGMPSYWKTIVLDLINRQKVEIERLTKRENELVEDKAHWINKWKEQVECTAELQKQVDELTEECKELRCEKIRLETSVEYWSDTYGEKKLENYELQKQVDELTIRTSELFHELQEEKRAYARAVKDMAKKVMKAFIDEFNDPYRDYTIEYNSAEYRTEETIEDIAKLFVAKQFGVEVE